jgi:hypothetical protein
MITLQDAIFPQGHLHSDIDKIIVNGQVRSNWIFDQCEINGISMKAIVSPLNTFNRIPSPEMEKKTNSFCAKRTMSTMEQLNITIPSKLMVSK